MISINDNGEGGENRYANYGPHTVSPQLTGAANYEDGWAVVKTFVDEAHKRNIRVFLDIITWGTSMDAPLHTEHSDWYTGEEIYGGYKFNWTNTDLYNWFKQQMVTIIENTGADGFRIDCGSQFCGTQLFKDVRSTLLGKDIKIAMFSESAEVRDGTFDFEEHSVTNTNTSDSDFWNTADFYIENNIVDAVKNGTTLGTSDLLSKNEGGKGRFYSSLISCHDSVQYGSENLVPIGYGAILAPFIPMWYLGEVWNNSVVLSPDQQLYRNRINWSLVDTKRDYYESIKRMIRIRRTYSDIFEASTVNHRDSNICAVETDGTLQAYARYANDKAVIVVPNNGTTAQKFNITLPYVAASLSEGNYHIFDLMNEATLLSGSSTELNSFTASVNAGEVGVYLVEKYTDITNYYFYENGNNWEIQLIADQNIQLGDGSYWWNNLQQIAANASEEHNAFAKLLRDNILINGISVDEALNSSLNPVASTRIWTTNNSKLIITINKNDNPYGVSTASDLTLEIKEGLTFNGYALLPKKLGYVAKNKQFVDLNTANIVSAEYSDGAITITADSILESSEDVLAAIGQNILIDGNAVTSGVTAAAKELKIEYQSSGNFELQIKSGITLNGKELMPARYSFKFTEAKDSYQVGEYLIPEPSENGANITGAALLSVDSGYCNGHNAANWVLRLKLDKNIYSNYTGGYYDRHFQVDSKYGAGISSKLLINGKSLNECFGDGDKHSVLHVKAYQDILEIAIPKNNSFGFDGNRDFEISVSDQIEVPDGVINPKSVKYSTAKGFFTIADISEPVFTTKNVLDTGISAGYVEIKSQESNFCNSHGESYNPAQWLINITFKESFNPGFGNYWNRHLQAYTDTKDMICSKIKLNGKTLADCIAADTRDAYTAVHVAVAGSNNVLQIAVPKDNKFGFDGDKDLTVEVLSGITLGSKTLNPVYVKHLSAFTTATVTENAPNRVKPVISSNADIYLYFDKTFDISLGNNTAQNITAQTTAVNRNISHALCKHIKINGETVQEILSRGNSLYAVQISVGNSDDNEGYIRLRLDIVGDKEALNSGERFTVEFTEGFVFDGYSIPRTVCTKESKISTGFWVEQGGFTNGTVEPRRAAGDWSTKDNILEAGAEFYGNVKPDDGYQLKAGSLTYSYLYKGEKKEVSLLETKNGTQFYHNIADVVGQIDAKFVKIDENVNFATVGATSNKKGNGLRFVTRMYLDNIDFENNQVTINGITYSIVDYGTLIGLDKTELNVDTSVKAKCEPKVYRNIGGVFVDFTAELVNVDSTNFATEFAARGYFTYADSEGNETTVYTDVITRSVNGIK